MKIGIDISQIAYKGSGVARFTHGLINSILNFDKENKWVFFFSSMRNEFDHDLKNKIKKKGHKIFDYPFPPTLLALIWNKYHIFKIDNLIKNLDWFITSDWTEPPSNYKKATIVHDLVYKRFPETLSNIIKINQENKLKQVKKESKIIFADSNSTKQDLITFLNISPNKITINYPGVEIQNTSKDLDNRTLNKYSLNKKFLLSVGKIEPRKNIQTLIDSFLDLNLHDIELVVVGEYGWGPNLKKSNNIKMLGYVSDTELFSLYKSSYGFIYPSLWEGFGYPIIEAMGIGCPVATSDASSMREISNGASFLFNPLKKSEIQSSILRLINDTKGRSEIIKKGYENFKKYTWKNYYLNLINRLKNY